MAKTVVGLVSDPDPVLFLSGSGSGLQKFTDPVCPQRLDPDPFNIRPNPKPWSWAYHTGRGNLTQWFSSSAPRIKKKGAPHQDNWHGISKRTDKEICRGSFAPGSDAHCMHLCYISL